MNSIIKFTQDSPKTEPWIRVGSGFTTKAGNGFNITIGNQVPKEKGSKELVETVEELNLRAGDSLYLGIATNKDGQPVVTKNGATVYRLSLKPREEQASQ